MPNARQPDNPEADKRLISALIGEDMRGFDQALREGASVNAFSKEHDKSALMIAAELNRTYEIRQLIEGGADVNAQNSRSQSAIEFALKRSATTMRELDDLDGQVKFAGAKLIASAPDFDANTVLSNGKSARQYAGMRQATDVMEILDEKIGGKEPETPVAKNAINPPRMKPKV